MGTEQTMRNFSEEKLSKVIELHNQGLVKSKIGKQIMITHQTVVKYLDIAFQRGLIDSSEPNLRGAIGKDEEYIKFFKAGYDSKQIGQMFGVHRCTVNRAIREHLGLRKVVQKQTNSEAESRLMEVMMLHFQGKTARQIAEMTRGYNVKKIEKIIEDSKNFKGVFSIE